MSSSPIASLAASALEVSANQQPPCEKCMDQAELQGVILFPSMGTPYIAPASEKSIKVYLITEAKCLTLFDIAVGGKGHAAPLAWYFINNHLRLTAFKDEAKTKADIKSGSLYTSHGAAQKGIKVWYRGTYSAQAGMSPHNWGNQLHDHEGRHVANLRQSAADFFIGASAAYGPLAPAHHLDRKVADVSNQPLTHLFELELSLDGLKVKPTPNKAYTLSWMVTCVYRQAKTPGGQPVLKGVTEWEHQDKLIYDFLWMMKQRKQHFAQPFAYNVASMKQNDVGSQLLDEANRLKAYHPVMFSTKPALHIGHCSDVHISSRQFALARSQAQAIPGVSEPLGPKVTNCFSALKEVFDNLRGQGADAIFITGDLLDFNQNMDPAKLSGGMPKDQWRQYDLSLQFSGGKALDPALYPRGIDDMLVYSLVKYSYQHDCPVFMTVGNHEAYDVPFAISPRVGGSGAAVTLKQTQEINERQKRIQALRQEAAALQAKGQTDAANAKLQEAKELQAEQPVVPGRVSGLVSGVDGFSANAQANEEEYYKNPPMMDDGSGAAGVALAGWMGRKWDGLKKPQAKPGDLQPQYAPEGVLSNGGIPLDHNLTIYEACMAYGPSYNQILKSWNFTPANLDWFFMIFTPLADYAVKFGDSQCLIGLDWGDSEIMVNADMKGGELGAATVQAAYDSGALLNPFGWLWKTGKASYEQLQGLPRADKSVSDTQQRLIRSALKNAGTGSRNVLFSHFTLLNYEDGVPYEGDQEFLLQDDTFNNFNRGTFSLKREWLFSLLNDGCADGRVHFTMSGHSHRAGAYSFSHVNGNPKHFKVRAFEPGEPGDGSADDNHHDTYRYGGSRVIVSSSGGPIGGQNYCGELAGWNRQPPSGTLLKTDLFGAPDEVRRIVAKQPSCKPRFCAALDYLVVVAGQPVITWGPAAPESIATKAGQYWMAVEGVMYGEPFVDKLEFFVWQSSQVADASASRDSSGAGAYKCFSTTLKRLTASERRSEKNPRYVYLVKIGDEDGLYAALKSSEGAPAFARVHFNQSLKTKSLYDQYNFDDPWCFPVTISPRRMIERTRELAGQVPDFRKLGSLLPDQFRYKVAQE